MRIAPTANACGSSPLAQMRSQPNSRLPSSSPNPLINVSSDCTLAQAVVDAAVDEDLSGHEDAGDAQAVEAQRAGDQFNGSAHGLAASAAVQAARPSSIVPRTPSRSKSMGSRPRQITSVTWASVRMRGIQARETPS